MQKTLEISTVILFGESNDLVLILFAESNDRGDFQRFLHRFCKPNIGSNKKLRIYFFVKGQKLDFEKLLFFFHKSNYFYSTFYSDPSIEKAMQKTLEISTA